MPRNDAIIGELAVVGALAINWLSTTHADEIGHDHHCQVPKGDPYREASPADLDRCSCGWATFYRAYLAIFGDEHGA